MARYVRGVLEEGKTDLVGSLLDSDQQLFKSIRHHLSSGRRNLIRIMQTLKQIRELRARLHLSSDVPLSTLYIRAMSGDLNDSPLVRELLLSVKKASSDTLIDMLEDLQSFGDVGVAKAAQAIAQKLDTLVAGNKQALEPLRSEHDIRHETLRTTIVAQKVELSKQKSEITRADSEYSKIVQELHQTLEEHLRTVLFDPRTVFMQEVFMYDIKGPHRDSFTPKPRFIIERALSAPHDYLNCTCCQPLKAHSNEVCINIFSATMRTTNYAFQSVILPSNPPTSLLYQLYLESGALINGSDFYSAFSAIVASADEDEKRTMLVRPVHTFYTAR